MKLQIIEYNALNYIEGTKNYRYTLEIDGRMIVWKGTGTKRLGAKDAYNELENILVDKVKDYNLLHYPELNKITGIENKVIFEKEVDDKILKELKIKKKLKDIDKDFV